MANEQLILADGTTDVMQLTTPGTGISAGFTDITNLTALGTNFAPEFAILNDLVVICNGQGATRTINSSGTVASPSNAPTSRWVVNHLGYLFFFNDPVSGQRSRLQWSDRGAITFTTTNFEEIAPNDGAYGTGMVSFGDELILFKGPSFASQSYGNGSMWRVISDVFDASNPTYFIEKIPLPKNVSLVHGRTAKIYKGALIFATNDGFYAYFGGGRQPENISESIRGEINGWEISDVHSSQRRAAATVWRNRYICSLYTDEDSADLVNNRIYVLDEGKWWVDILSEGADNFQAGSGSAMDWVVYGNRLYSASSLSNVLRQWDDTAFQDTMDAGTAENVNFSYLTKEFDFQEEQDFQVAYVHLRRQSSGDLTFEVNVDQRGAVSTTLDMDTPDTGDTANTSSNILRKQVLIGRNGRSIQFRAFNLENVDVEIYAIELVHSPLRSRQI